jgi:transposase-like protein
LPTKTTIDWNYSKLLWYINFVERYIIQIQNFKDLADAWERIKEMAPLNIEISKIRCKHCNSSQISKYGRYKDVQLWWCQHCQRKFTGNDAAPGMKVSFAQIQFALSMYFKGVPLSSIRKQLKEEFDYYPSDSTIYRWVHQSTEKVLEATKAHHPQVCNTWIAYESLIQIGFKKYWISDLIDLESHFLLASRLSNNRKIEDIRILIESAMQKAHKIPEKIITRNTSRYLKAIEQILGLDFDRVQIIRPGEGHSMKFSVYWHSILKGRSRITHSLKSLELVHLTLKGWMINYNYYSPQRSLKDRTPADVAGWNIEMRSIIG